MFDFFGSESILDNHHHGTEIDKNSEIFRTLIDNEMCRLLLIFVVIYGTMGSQRAVDSALKCAPSTTPQTLPG